MPGFSDLSLPRWHEEDAPLVLPPGFHPDGVLGGLNLDGSVFERDAWANGTHILSPPGTLGEYPTAPIWREREISPPALNPNDPIFRGPQLPQDKPVGMVAPSQMTVSPRAIEFLKSYEKGPDGGPALKPYASPEKGADTVGWGHKMRPGEDFSRGLTPEQADALFLKDLARHQRIVQNSVKVPLSQQQFDALVSLAYNLPSAFADEQHSTLLRELNKGNYSGAAGQLPRWNHAGKAVMPGLTERRGYERDMFLNGVYTNHK